MHPADADTLRRLARGGVHQGVVARSRGLPEASLDELAAAGTARRSSSCSTASKTPTTSAPSCARSHAAGGSGLVRQTRHAAPLDGAAAKASAGAVYHVPVADVVNIARALEDLKAAGVWTVGLDADAETALR